jgi:hypothetical protein
LFDTTTLIKKESLGFFLTTSKFFYAPNLTTIYYGNVWGNGKYLKKLIVYYTLPGALNSSPTTIPLCTSELGYTGKTYNVFTRIETQEPDS